MIDNHPEAVLTAELKADTGAASISILADPHKFNNLNFINYG